MPREGSGDLRGAEGLHGLLCADSSAPETVLDASAYPVGILVCRRPYEALTLRIRTLGHNMGSIEASFGEPGL